MRERGGYVTCAVATANGFAQSYAPRTSFTKTNPSRQCWTSIRQRCVSSPTHLSGLLAGANS